MVVIGANYFIFGCSSSGRKSGIYNFKIPQGNNECNRNRGKDRERTINKISLSMKDIILKFNL